MQKIALILFTFLFIGCATKSKPVYVSFKTKNFSLSDQGFYQSNIFYKKLIIYKYNQYPISIYIKKDNICIKNRCYKIELFNKMICNSCNENIFEKIISKQPIKCLGKTIKTKNGFIQKQNRCLYKVNINSALFKGDKATIYIKFLQN